MGKNSRKRKAERKAQKRLNEQLTKLESTRIPAGVALKPSLPETLSYLDGTNYQLIFERYNHKESELHNLDAKDFKAFIEKLNTITKQNSRTISSTTLIRDKLNNSGDYASLYNGLEDDIELIEIQYKDTGRIICYFINEYYHSETPCSYCCIVAVLKRHRRT